MLGSSNRSASPLTSRSNKSLQPHQNHPTRQSLNGPNTLTKPSHLNNPKKFSFLTPANTPSEFGGRSWVGGEEKENGKGQFLKEKLRSPAKGSKNFMAPTISAASKFTPSPRKKVLVERNDPVRTSITLSHGKATFFSSVTPDVDRKLDFGSEEKNSEGVVSSAMASSQQIKVVPMVTKSLRKVTFKEVTLNSHNLAESSTEKVSTNLDSEQKPDHSSVELSSINLSCSPHEPNTNLLSSPRIDVFKINFEGSDSDEKKHLEDSCMCELSENLSFVEGLEQSETGDSLQKCRDVPSIEPLVSESLPLSTPIADEIAEVSSLPKQKTKPKTIRNWKPVCFFLVLLGTFMLSATNFPKMHSLVPKDLNFEISSQVAAIAKVKFEGFTGKVKQWSANFPKMHSIVSKDLNFELHEWSEIAKEHFDEFTRKLEQWSANSISYMYKIVLPVVDVENMGPLQKIYLTILDDAYQINGLFTVNSKDKAFEEVMGLELEVARKEEGEDIMEEVDNDKMKEDEQQTEEVEDRMEEVEDEMRGEVEETYSSFDSAPVAPDTELKMDTFEDNHISAESDKAHEENESGSSVAPIYLENQEGLSKMVSTPESPDTTQTQLKLYASSAIDYDGSAAETEILLKEKQSLTSMESEKIAGNQEISSMSSHIPEVPEAYSENSRVQALIMTGGTYLVLLALGSAAVIIYQKKLSKNTSICVDLSPASNSKIEFLQESSLKDMIGESCASEMSSSQRCSSSYRKKKNINRESWVCSSEYSFGSPSYGSFTTYETIPIKHGDGDEEIMTPVRRSIRVRKQQVTAQ